MPQTRQLACIMFTDIVGYTALMGNDEKRAFEILTKNRELQKPVIEKYNGRWIKELGDGVMASFQTVSDAVHAAIQIQEQCRTTGGFSLRIGIHLGEVVFDNGDIFGDGVNVASRIQSVAPVGGIAVSETVYQNVVNKPGISTRYIKTERLKNVKEPVKIYQVFTGSSVGTPLKLERTLKPFAKPKSRAIAFFAVFLLVLAGSYFLYNAVSHKISGYDQNVEKSIAVLPFVNMSNDKEQEYFSDGLSEELLNLLAKTPGLKVIARTSSFAFKGKNEDIRSISEKLGVAHILEGSVRKSGKQLRVTAQLIQARDGSHLWSEVFEREMNDVFKLQDEIATAVVRQLKLQLLPEQTSGSKNPEVHNLIMKGNYFFEHLDEENVNKALTAYQQAAALDSTDARAWAMIAKVYSRAAWQNYIPQQDGYEKARSTVLKALSLNPGNTDAQIILAGVKLYYDFNWEEAESLATRALEREPANVLALNIMGVLNQVRGHWKKAITFHERAIAHDPLRPIFYSNQGANYTYDGQYQKANEMYKKALEINPQFQRAHMYIGRNYLLQGKNQAALQEMQNENISFYRHFGLALATHAVGDKKNADTLLNSFVRDHHKQWPYLIAELYAYRNEKEQAIHWLKKAYEQNDSWLTWIKGDPLLRNIRSEPEYLNILNKMNLD